MNPLLTQKIEHIVQLLDEAGEKHWADWLRQDAADIRAGDARGVEHFLAAFGGMGSLNDLYLCPQNGHRVEPEEVDRVNQQLRQLLDEAWALTVEHLTRSRERGRMDS